MRGVLKQKTRGASDTRDTSDASGTRSDAYPALLTGLDDLIEGLRDAGHTAWADLAASTRGDAPLELDNARVVIKHHRIILDNARHDADRIRATAEEALADTIREQRRLLDRDTLTAAANDTAEQIVAEARRQAEQIVAEARRQAEQIVAEADRPEPRPHT